MAQVADPRWPHHRPIPAPIPRGWECPKCGAVMAPGFPHCVNCKGKPKGGTAE